MSIGCIGTQWENGVVYGCCESARKKWNDVIPFEMAAAAAVFVEFAFRLVSMVAAMHAAMKLMLSDAEHHTAQNRTNILSIPSNISDTAHPFRSLFRRVLVRNE